MWEKIVADDRITPQPRRSVHVVRALLYVALLGYGVGAPTPAAIAAAAKAAIPKAWLQKKVTVAAAEAAHPGTNNSAAKGSPGAAKPFGLQHRKWEQLKAKMLPGDQLWTFSSPPYSWRAMEGSAGIALVRNGVPVQVIVTDSDY
jgi:hypothetical protein